MVKDQEPPQSLKTSDLQSEAIVASANHAKIWYSKKQEGRAAARRLSVFRYTSGSTLLRKVVSTQGLAKVHESRHDLKEGIRCPLVFY